MAEYVFTLRNVRKAHGDKVVLDNVTLSFLHGAKIGVVGPNGTGKSTLLKIMAGLEQPSNGDAVKDPEATVGILLQEPPLNEDKTVLGNVEEGAGEIKAKVDRYNEISAEMANPDADYDSLLAEMGKLQEELDERAQQTLRDAAARVPHHIPVTTLFRRGRAGAEIVAEANTGNHDAVFVGARGVGRVAALIGSVSQYVVRHAEVFVIVVHAPSTADD